MINFDEELRKFPRSMEIDQIEDAVNGHDLNDVTDIIREMHEQNKALQNQLMTQQSVVLGSIPMPNGQ